MVVKDGLFHKKIIVLWQGYDDNQQFLKTPKLPSISTSNITPSKRRKGLVLFNRGESKIKINVKLWWS